MSISPDAKKIKRWREERHWSQEHLAEIAGISPRTMQRIENGEKASTDSLKALAAVFDVDVAALKDDVNRQAQMLNTRKTVNARNSLRLGFMINLVCWVFGMIVFAGISFSDGKGGYTMVVPAIWWTVGLAGFGLVYALFEVFIRFAPNDSPMG